MSNGTTSPGPIPYIEAITAGLGQVTGLLPVALSAYTILFQIWKTANPAMTFDDYNKRLLAESTALTDFTAQWLIAHGYIHQPDGSWLPPTPH